MVNNLTRAYWKERSVDGREVSLYWTRNVNCTATKAQLLTCTLVATYTAYSQLLYHTPSCYAWLVALYSTATQQLDNSD